MSDKESPSSRSEVVSPSLEAGRERMRSEYKLLSEDVMSTINFGSNVPLDGRVADAILERPTAPVSFETIGASFKAGKWPEALKQLFALIFGGKNATQGLGLLAKEMDGLPARERAGLLAQLERAPVATSVIDKLKRSIIRTEVQRSLERQGYQRIPGGGIPASVKHVESRSSLGTILGSTEGPTPDIAGTLPLETVVPDNSYVYLDSEGRPLYVSKEKIHTTDAAGKDHFDQCPPVPVFLRVSKPKEKPRTREEHEEEVVSFLERTVQSGDILIVSQGGSSESVWHEVFEQYQRWKMGKPNEGAFHGTHVLVTAGNGKLFHVNQHGVASGSVRNIFRGGNYNAVSVGRINDVAMRQKFLEGAVSRAAKTKGYDWVGFLKMAAVGATAETGTDDRGICADFVAKSGVPELAGVNTPMEIASSSHIDLVASVEFGRE